MQHETHLSDVKTFYMAVGILAFCIIVLQPLTMLLVMFAQALMQAQ